MKDKSFEFVMGLSEKEVTFDTYPKWCTTLQKYHRYDDVGDNMLIGIYTFFNTTVDIALEILKYNMEIESNDNLEIATKAHNKNLLLSIDTWKNMLGKLKNPIILLWDNQLINPINQKIINELTHIKNYL